jgi:F-type H+-transporting ATPase subunit a
MPPISIAAESLFHIGNFPVTNSILMAWVVVAIFFVTGLFIRSRASLQPSGLMAFIDWVMESALKEVEKVVGDRHRTKLFFPICGSLFFFILLSNWMGLLPGVGSIGIKEIHAGELELIPLFRPATSDLNFTLAIAAFSILATHIFGIFTIGFINHISKFFNLRGIILAFKKGPMQIMVAIVEFFVGLIESIGEVAKTVSLALRLFGNIFAGEVLLTVIYSLVSFFAPLPFIFLELLVGIIQATVFAMLVLVFLKSSTEGHGEEVNH